MLDPKLCEWSSERDCYNRTFTVPVNWEMAPNTMTKTLGHIPNPKKARWFGSSVVYPDLYRGVLIDNSSMMFLRHDHEEYHILAIDGVAWLLMQFLTGGRELPSKEEMRRQNLEQALYEMKHYPYCRRIMDRSYMEEWNEDTDPGWKVHEHEFEKRYKYDLMLMARTMREANHSMNIGTIEGLNKVGKALCRLWLSRI
jgi:hypothetical protein